MADPNATTTPLPATDLPAALAQVRPSDLRLVLFGLPAAGKSSLLGALAQAAQTQEHLLHGRLVPRTDGLNELQKRLYVENPRPTAEEVAPYPVDFEPFAHDGQAGGSKVEAVLIDCDGRVANDLLARRATLRGDSPEGTLAREVIEADTLILVVDAAAPPVQVDAEFAEFGRFLRLLELGRGQRSEVGGLPVFLVLTKCDLLAQPDDTNIDWLDRIEERKRQVHRRFQDFLARRGRDEGPLPFGRIDLHVWATAVKRPALGPAPAKPREPYGVAELFRQCLESAVAFRRRQQHSGRRLAWTVTGAVGALAGMAVLALGLVLGRPQERTNPLLNKVERYQSQEGQTPSARLRGDSRDLQARISELTDLKNDPNFGELPPDRQEFITQRLQELEAYQAYRRQFQQVRPVPEAQSERDLKQVEEALNKLQPPEAYRGEWGQTEAVLERGQRLADVKALREAVNDAEDWFRGLKSEGERLLQFTIGASSRGPDGGANWAAWYDQFRKLQDRAGRPPFREEDPVPNSRLSYATVLRFNRVAEARAGWQTVDQRLSRVRDLAAAFGLIGSVPDRPPLLVIPRPPEFTAPDARGRLLDLARAYPRYKEEFVLGDLPERVAEPLRQAARTSYDRLLDAGRAEVLRRLQQASPDGQETFDHWGEVRRWLQGPEELSSWRVLAGVLGRMQEADWTDPVNALVAFLGRDHFDLDLKRMSLEVPFSLNARPAGKLSLYHPPTNGQGPALTFEVGEPETDSERRLRIYPLRPEGSARLLVYHPGDSLWASLPVEYGGNAGWVLDWVRGRSEVYQFDHLSRAPQLHQKDQASSKGEVAQGVALAASQGSTLPTVPELMPVVKLEKR
jgi:hypothetical protein